MLVIQPSYSDYQDHFEDEGSFRFFRGLNFCLEFHQMLDINIDRINVIEVSAKSQFMGDK